MLKINKKSIKELFPFDNKNLFKITSEMSPAGDQNKAIKELVSGIQKEDHNQVLLGVTGSGKTFTIANVIQSLQRPALIMAPNKTLAAQLYGEMKTLFPKTGNVVIENKYGGEPSGIETTKATWWAYITKDNLYWITPNKIKECIKDNNLQSLDCAPLNGDTKRKNLYLIKETLFKEYTTSSEKINGRN